MPGLFFPSLTALRLALSSGLVTATIARAPAAAGFDSYGRLWLELPELPPRESLAALSRIGVQALGVMGVQTEPVRCWAELLPLTPYSSESPVSEILFVVADRAVARFCSRLRRANVGIPAVRLHEAAGDTFAFVAMTAPPTALLTESGEPGAASEPFIEQVPGVWVRYGWRHPLPEHLVVPPEQLLLIRAPRSVLAVAALLPPSEVDEFVLTSRSTRLEMPPPGAPSVPVRLRLARRPDAEKESFWVLDGKHADEFWGFCAYSDERVTRRLEAGMVSSSAGSRIVVRTAGQRPPVTFPFPTASFATDPRVPGLLIPTDRILRPAIRLRELARVLGLGTDRHVWIESTQGGGLGTNVVETTVLQPVADRIEYSAPAAEHLVVPPRTEPFALTPLPVVLSEATSAPTTVHVPLPLPELKQPDPTGIETPRRIGAPGWFLRSLRHLALRLHPRREVAVEPASVEDQPRPALDKIERNLTSPDALLHGHDWAARRRELERRLFHELPSLGPDGRAARWADLGVVYATTGNPTDAAVCWMNAVWESPVLPAAWLEQWFTAECRAAKLTDQSGGLERWLSEPARPGVGRVVAAYTAWAGFATTTPAEFPAALPRILTHLEQHFDDLPIRSAWLARLAATQLCEGDTLGLARWRDRVLTRLAERGPGLDLDEPSFLRFHGTASADRFQTAREWLVRVREPALAWVQRHGSSGSGLLRSCGLEAEIESTSAYAQFMLAWGLGCLGERTRAKDWAARARKILTRAPGPHVDPAVPAFLGELFLHRVKEAQEGRPPKVGLPPELRSRLDTMNDLLARHSVDRLRHRSRILEPLDRVRAFRGLEVKVFWGNDRLGERLSVLADQPDPAGASDEAESLLRLCSESPGTTTIPRIVLALLEIAPRLDLPTVLRVFDLLPTAIDWMEAWLAGGPWSENERPKRLLQLQTQMIEAASGAAAALLPALAGSAVSQLLGRLMSSGAEVRRPLIAAAAPVFRCLRRLDLRAEAGELMQFLDPGESGSRGDSERNLVERLGLAIGWFTAGNEDAGNRVLNEARESLYLAKGLDMRGRTELAIACAEALGFAPPRIAHGRLEEIFQRLGPVDVQGSTDTYFTLKPLQLIDAVVRSVVTDEFALGPAVRGWLDDDEFLIRGRVHRDLDAILHAQGIYQRVGERG